MRVLWFTNLPLPQVVEAAGLPSEGFGGHWMTELCRSVSKDPSVILGVATAFPGIPDLRFEKDSVRFYSLHQARRSATFIGSRADVEKCAEIIHDFKPDLIHIHGSERFFGLIKVRRLTHVPAVVSLQGLLGPYSVFRHFFGALSPLEVIQSTRLVELLLGMGLLWQFADMRRGAKQEALILNAVDGVLGRTAWDRACARRLSPRALYWPVGEILREPFYASRWSLAACERHTIIYTNAGAPRRGTENLLAAAALLCKDFPALRLRLAGVVSARSGYGRFLRKRIRRLGLDDRVELLGYLDGPAMARELVRAHAFVISSYVENSPNSLAEAMLVGMPCIASFVGGIPSMVDHGQNGLLYPVDDIRRLAEQMRLVLGDDEVSGRMGSAARKTALARHDPGTVTAQLLAAYAGISAEADRSKRVVAP